MNTYVLNYLRFLTKNQIADNILQKSFDWKVNKDGKLTFKFKANINTKDWKFVYGTSSRT